MRAKRLTIEYKDINNNTTRLEVWQDGFTGTAATRDGQGQPLTIDWGDSGNQDFPIIYGSSATIRFYQDSALEFSDLFTDTAALKPLLYVYKNNILIWTGTMEFESWEESRVSAPVPVEVTFTDGLGLLTDIDFTDEYDNAYTGEATIADIIDKCLSHTELTLNLFHAIDWENDASVGFMALSVDQYAFAGLNCAEVLENILFGCRIFQREAAWYIISYSNYDRASMIVTIPASLVDDFKAGDFRSGDFRTSIAGTDTRYLFPTTSSFWFEDELGIEILPGIKKWTYLEKYGIIENLILNGSFNDSDSNWTENGLSIFAHKYDTDKYFALMDGGNSHPATAYDITKYIKQIVTGFETTIKPLRISMKYGSLGAVGENIEMYAEIRLVASGLTYYAQYNYLSASEDINLTWTTTRNMLRLGVKIESSMFAWDNISAASFQEVGNSMRTFEMFTDGLPADGDIEVYLYGAYTTLGSEAVFTDVSLNIYNLTFEPNVDENETTIENDLAKRYIPNDLEFVIADFPGIYNADKVYRCGLFDSVTGTMTTEWRRTDHSTYYGFNYFRVKLLTSMERNHRQNYQALLADIKPSLKSVIVDTDADNKKLLENGISYDDYMNTIEGQYTEILSPDLPKT